MGFRSTSYHRYHRRACEGKPAFPSLRLAQDVAHRRRHGRNKDPERKTSIPYKCKACGLWHIGGPDDD